MVHYVSLVTETEYIKLSYKTDHLLNKMNVQDIINTYLQSTDIPLLTAFLLGLIVAFNPCQLSINISALTYISRTGSVGYEYALGRAITYTLLGWIMMCLTGGGKNINGISHILSYGEAVLPYVTIVIGVFLIYRAFHHHEHHDDCHNCNKLIKRNGPLGSLILGMTLALAFCPESAIFYFGILLPLSMSCEVGAALPPIFAISTCIPVIILAFIMQRAIDKAKRMTHHFEHFQQVMNGITGIIFIVIAILMMM